MKKIFIDMDGTIARFYDDNDALQRMYDKHFFLTLRPYRIVKEIKKLQKNYEVYILSACIDSPYCRNEKCEWLAKYLPTIPRKNYIFTMAGENKAEKIMRKFNLKDLSNCILIDDYSVNLNQWETYKGIGIKRLNEINNKTKKIYSYKFTTYGELNTILTSL